VETKCDNEGMAPRNTFLRSTHAPPALPPESALVLGFTGSAVGGSQLALLSISGPSVSLPLSGWWAAFPFGSSADTALLEIPQTKPSAVSRARARVAVIPALGSPRPSFFLRCRC
jgi:hypothetical protein